MSTLSEAIAQLKSGGMVVLVDDEGRENEGDIVVAGEFATSEAINFMARYGRGLICLCLTGEQVDRLQLPPMTANNRARRTTAFTVSIEARDGISTGISAKDRARTVEAAINPDGLPGDVVSPGHMFPLRAADMGVLARDGHTEGAIDLMRLAGLRPSAVICEVMKDDGEMARLSDLKEFSALHGLPLISVRQIIDFRLAEEVLVEEVARSEMPSEFSDVPFTVHAFRSLIDGTEHLAIVRGPLAPVPLVRVHSECLTGDALGSLRCDCGAQLQESLRQIGTDSGGIVVYLRGQEGRGIGLANKIRAYNLQDNGHDTVDANSALGFSPDQRDYGAAAHILKALGIKTLALLSNNPAKVDALQRMGLCVSARVPLIARSTKHNRRYLDAKRDRLGHDLPKNESVAHEQ